MKEHQRELEAGFSGSNTNRCSSRLLDHALRLVHWVGQRAPLTTDRIVDVVKIYIRSSARWRFSPTVCELSKLVLSRDSL